ncbi:DUF4349 domain-containing protein [Kitasatospora sp. GAS1066B]|uniref:DUF4349 domain-containing protein n=1 Tax=Kitasatospora sp. GAS1066B TaxID=3156271 RepID=UPI0035147940
MSMSGISRAGAALAAAAVLALAGCSADGGGNSAVAGPQAAQAPQPAQAAPGQAAGQPAKAGAAGSAPGASAAPAADPRAIAYTGQLGLRVDSIDGTVQRAEDLATRQSGFVEHENSGDSGSAEVVLRIPSAAFQQSFDQLAGFGTVLSRSTQADDLTQQVADVDSRVKSQQASVDRVRQLMSQAASLNDIVTLEGELSSREAALESLQAQQQQLATQTSLSTITVDLQVRQQPAAVVGPRPKPGRGFWGSVGHALAGGCLVLVAVLRTLLVVLAAAAPFLAVAAPVLWFVLRRRRAAARVEQPEPAE